MQNNTYKNNNPFFLSHNSSLCTFYGVIFPKSRERELFTSTSKVVVALHGVDGNINREEIPRNNTLWS